MLAVAGGKGGCGKTTIALGLALAAARAGRTALAVDADVDVPDLHRLAGVAGPEEAGESPHPVPEAPAAAVLPAGPETAPEDLRERLAAARSREITLIDCPAGAGRDAAVPLRAADRALVVTTGERAALADAAKTAAMARAVGTPVAGAVLTRGEGVPEGVADLLGTPLIEPVPAADRPLSSPAVRRCYGRVVRRLRRD